MKKLDRFLFGKKYVKGNKDKKFLIMKRYFYTSFFTMIFLVICLLIVFSDFLLFSEALHEYDHPSYYKTNIVYDNLTEEEMSNIQSLIDNLKEDYVILSKDITFTKDIGKYYLTKRGDENCLPDLAGFNRDKHIYILVNNNYDDVAITLCHELTHSFLSGAEETHSIVRDLASQYVCYKNPPKIRLKLSQ